MRYAAAARLESDVMRDTKWLDAFDERLEDVTERWMRARWADFTHEPGAAVADLQRERGALLTDRATRQQLASLRDQDLDTRTRRRVDILERAVLQATIDGDGEIAALAAEIQSGHLVPFQPVVDGEPLSRTAVRQRIRLDPDRERRRAAMLYREPLGERVEPLVRRLASLRNARARSLGFPDFVALRMHVERLDRSWYDATMAAVEGRTARLWQERLAELRAVLGHAPAAYDLDFAMERLAGDNVDERFPLTEHAGRARALARAVGFDERVEDIAVRIEDIPYGGLEMPIAIPEDVRILVNPPDGFDGLHTVVHEFGHCVHARYNEQRGDLLQRNEPGHFNEAVAEILGHFVLRPEYLERHSDLPEATRRAVIGKAVRGDFGRWLLVSADLELALYADPGADLGRRARETERRILGVESETRYSWAADAFLIEYPVYKHAYLVADMAAAQVSAAFSERYGTVFDARVARDLIEHVCAPGNLVDWDEKVARLTGRALSVEAWVRELEAGAAL